MTGLKAFYTEGHTPSQAKKGTTRNGSAGITTNQRDVQRAAHTKPKWEQLA